MGQLSSTWLSQKPLYQNQKLSKKRPSTTPNSPVAKRAKIAKVDDRKLDFVYDSLFVEGLGWDIEIRAFDRSLRDVQN